MTINKAIAMRCTKLMLEKNMTAYKICKKSLIPYSTLSNILLEKHTDSKVSTLYRLAFAFDMTLRDFLNDKVFDDVDILKDL